MSGVVCAYDDPYKALAYNLAIDFSAEDVGHMLSKDDYIKLLVKKEVQLGLDIVGPFSDCVVCEAVSNDLINWKHEVADFSERIYARLDLDRLRRELRVVCEDLGIKPIFLNRS